MKRVDARKLVFVGTDFLGVHEGGRRLTVGNLSDELDKLKRGGNAKGKVGVGDVYVVGREAPDFLADW